MTGGEIVPFKPRSTTAVEPTRDVDSWISVISDVAKFADYISHTEFVPAALRGKPAAIAAAMLAGREAGVAPLRSLAHMHMVDGRPSMSAEQKRAQAMAAGHEIVYLETSSVRCVVKGRRRDSENWSTVTWTMDDAKKAELAGKSNWRKHPRRMLEARATGELCDMLFPDATGGMATYEELADDSDATGITASDQPANRRRTAQRKSTPTPAGRAGSAAAPAETPPPDPPASSTTGPPPLPGEDGYADSPTTPEPTENPTPDQPETAADSDGPDGPVTKPQLTKLHTVLSEIGIEDRDDRLNAASAIVGRRLNSSSELTRHEARTLIDTLEAMGNSSDPLGNLTELLDGLRETMDKEGS